MDFTGAWAENMPSTLSFVDVLLIEGGLHFFVESVTHGLKSIFLLLIELGLVALEPGDESLVFSHFFHELPVFIFT